MHGALGIEAALVVLKDSLLALAACHATGVAHGDIKPEGVVLTPAGRVRLVDFGLWTSAGRKLLARSTPFYLAPEQWSGRPAAHAGDVYAATITFFECLVGAPPFYADGVAELSVKHERSTPQIDVVPEPIREIVLRGLAKDPGSRPEARSLLAHVDAVAVRAVGSDWEPRGRRELAALLADRSVLPDMFVPPRRSGGWEHCRPVRLAAVMGGALALAAGLSSPPLAVIVPGGSIFGSFGRSPVLAFPEPDRDTVPLRVVTNGPLADRALMPAVKAGTAGPVARARPPAPSILAPRIQSAPYAKSIPEGLRHDTAHSDGAAPSTSTRGQYTPAAPACSQQIVSGSKPCTAANPEQSPLDSDGATSDPSQVAIPVLLPVELPVPVEIPVQAPGEVPVPVEVSGPAQAPKSIPIQDKIQPRKENKLKNARIQTDVPGKKARTGPKDASVKADEQPANRPQGRTGYRTSNYGNSDSRKSDSRNSESRKSESRNSGSDHSGSGGSGSRNSGKG
jgi:serine/threonine-protein kinase